MANGYAKITILWNGGKNNDYNLFRTHKICTGAVCGRGLTNVSNINYNLFTDLGFDRVRETE